MDLPRPATLVADLLHLRSHRHRGRGGTCFLAVDKRNRLPGCLRLGCGQRQNARRAKRPEETGLGGLGWRGLGGARRGLGRARLDPGQRDHEFLAVALEL